MKQVGEVVRRFEDGETLSTCAPAHNQRHCSNRSFGWYLNKGDQPGVPS